MTKLITDYDYEPLIAIDRHNRVIWHSPVGLGPSGEYLRETVAILVEECADLLFIALTGHTMREGPGGAMADCFRARAARALIAERAGRDPAWRVVHGVIQEHWHGHIIPWWKMVIFNQHTGEIKEPPGAWDILDLHTGRKLNLREHCYVEVNN